MEAPFDQKTAALMSRINFRDLFDLAFVLAFVMESHGNTLRSGQIRRADALLAGWKRFASRFSDAFERDEVLPDPATLDTTLLGFRRVIAAQLRLRWAQVQVERVPIPVGRGTYWRGHLSKRQ